MPLLLLAGCAEETIQRPPPPPVDWKSLAQKGPGPDLGHGTATDKERAVAAAFVKALGTPDFSGLKPMLDDEVHFSFNGTDDARGTSDVVRQIQALFGGLSHRSVALSRIFLTDNTQVLEWVLTGSHDATQKQVFLRGLSALWTRDDGRLTDIHLYFDHALLLAQLGEGPKGVSAVSVTPPSRPAETFEQTGTPEETANVGVVRDTLDALENNNETAYADRMAEDVEVVGLESSWQGRPAAHAYFKSMRKAIGDLDTTIDAAWGVGPFVVCEYHIVGEQRGPVGWVPAQKDNFLKLYLADVAAVSGGKITRIWRYDDPSQALSSTKVAKP